MKLLLHTCCAPCSVYCIDSLRKEEIEPTVYWFNPNIHPYMEYKARRDCLKEYTKSINVEAIFEENYGLDDFCKNVVNNLQTICKEYCYPVRLEQTAKYAKQNGYTHFSTTLLVSPYQNHEALVEVAKQMAKKYGVELTIHMDPVESDNEYVNGLKKEVNELLQPYGFTIHDFRVVTGPTHTNMVFDIVLPRDNKLKEDEILKMLNEHFKGRNFYFVTRGAEQSVPCCLYNLLDYRQNPCPVAYNEQSQQGPKAVHLCLLPPSQFSGYFYFYLPVYIFSLRCRAVCRLHGNIHIYRNALRLRF